MGNVSKHACADTASDLSDAFEVDDSRISRCTTNEKLWSMCFSDLLQLVVINLFRLSRHAVISDFVTEPGEVQRMAVREMAAVRKVHSQDLIAILDRREIDRHICLRATVRLKVSVVGAKQLFRAIDSGLLNDVSPFTPAVITFTRIAFGVLVCEHRSRGFEYGFTNEIL